MIRRCRGVKILCAAGLILPGSVARGEAEPRVRTSREHAVAAKPRLQKGVTLMRVMRTSSTPHATAALHSLLSAAPQHKEEATSALCRLLGEMWSQRLSRLLLPSAALHFPALMTGAISDGHSAPPNPKNSTISDIFCYLFLVWA